MADALTLMFDRGGRRVRTYARANPDRPGQQERRLQLAIGLKWCRDCRQWLPQDAVGKNGLCQAHENERARQHYRNNPGFRAKRKARAIAYRRAVEPMPPEAAALVAELFGGLCAYCDAPAQSWDHAHPVARGGLTEPGNMVPACIRCNSSKHDAEIADWLDRAPMLKSVTIEYLSTVGGLDL